jgi:hypothetical protein
MRALFLLLVLANVAFFAWSRLIAPGGSGADPQPLSRQIAPEKLRIVPAEELSRVSAPKPPAIAASAGVKCQEWGGFAPADAPRAEQALRALDLGERVSRRGPEDAPTWWVLIPPQAGSQNVRQAALRKADELKKLGVQDYFVVQEEGAYRWAVSLGVFRSEQAAQARLAAVQSQGVRSARVVPRDAHAAKVWLQVRGVDATLERRLRELASQLDGSELRECVP